METYTVYTEWVTDEYIDADTVATISRRIRPEDESLCIWVGDDANRLHLSVDVDELSYETAGRAGRVIASEAAALGNLSGRLAEVTVCSDEGQAVFKNSATELKD
jgi:hypothetical protein